MISISLSWVVRLRSKRDASLLWTFSVRSFSFCKIVLLFFLGGEQGSGSRLEHAKTLSTSLYFLHPYGSSVFVGIFSPIWIDTKTAIFFCLLAPYRENPFTKGPAGSCHQRDSPSPPLFIFFILRTVLHLAPSSNQERLVKGHFPL